MQNLTKASLILGVAAAGYACWALGSHYWNSRRLAQAVSAYDSGQIERAQSLAEGFEDAFIELENGCELLISVEAPGTDHKALETIARDCLRAERAVTMSLEALSKALLAQNRAAEAIEAIEVRLSTEGLPSERLHAALGWLYQKETNVEKSRFHYLRAIEVGEMTRLWVDRALKDPLSGKDKQFLRKIKAVIAEKGQTHDRLDAVLATM